MTICMSDIICVTNRKLCREDFLTRIEMISKSNPLGIILREKDLTEEEYGILAEKVLVICSKSDTKCIIHSFPDAAKKLDCKNLHVPLSVLRSMTDSDRKYFTTLGASCHSAEEAVEAEKLGCSYIIAGHIFDTDCKKGLPGRGVEFLKNVCKSVGIPVFAIGGISAENISQVLNSGAKGACIMSGIMKCDNPQFFLKELWSDRQYEIQ